MDGQMIPKNKAKCFLRNRRAVSPAVSTTILTSAIVVMLVITVSFVNTYLNRQIAQNDFNSMKQVMQNVGLQVDDVAWIPGRTQTVTFASKYGQITFRSPALTYNFYFNGLLVANFNVGIILYNIPISQYSFANNYFQEIFPASNSLLQNGSSAPICRSFVVEKMPMPDGSYVRVALVPIVRQLNATINGVPYTRFYLPILTSAPSPELSQSVTLTGLNVYHGTYSNVNNVTITLGFPNADNLTGMGLDSGFFNFASTSQTVTLSNAVAEIYGGNVTVSLGLAS
jgi:hypothetical protein